MSKSLRQYQDVYTKQYDKEVLNVIHRRLESQSGGLGFLAAADVMKKINEISAEKQN